MKVLYQSMAPHAGTERDARGTLIKKNVTMTQAVDNTGMQVAACCGSAYFDLAVIKEKASMYYDYPRIEMTVQQLMRKRVKGVGIWINNDGRVPETGEDDRSVFDTFTFDNGEKITFQYRKCEQ